ncbi:hypothetical protein [Burkholderia contaminans]|uniref:hypothetical protein n=1 Tax=Burkholderia contaminans TaxID=488447 RepID=UPI00115FCF7E|nr:hypothetical protein [Burkholderia contaminans]
MLIDRNIYSQLVKISDRPDRTDMEADKLWLRFLNSSRFGLDTVMCASEGRTKTPPTFDQFFAEANRISSELKTLLPRARIFQHKPEMLGQLFEVVQSFARDNTKYAIFLGEIAPLLASPVKIGAEADIEQIIVNCARKLQLRLYSSVVLAALSCLYEIGSESNNSIGRGVLKPKPNYSEQDAHNALSDINSLEFLARTAGILGDKVGFCTRDRDLARFWVNLKVSDPIWKGDEFSAALSPQQQLFPRLSAKEVERLLGRLL